MKVLDIKILLKIFCQNIKKYIRDYKICLASKIVCHKLSMNFDCLLVQIFE